MLAGDFRQTLPVIPHGTKADELQACLKASYIWNNIQRLSLMTNMRVLPTGDSSAVEFAASLLKLGNGAMVSENQDGTISMNNIGKTVATLQQLQDAVFSNVAHNFHDHKWLCQRAILAPKMMPPIPQTETFIHQLPGTM